MLRLKVVAAAIAIVIAACGGGGEGTPAGESVPARSAETQVDVGAVAINLLLKWEDQEAFYLVITALDRGFTVSQVIDAGLALTVDGDIPGVSPARSGPKLLRPTDPDGKGPPTATGPWVVAAAAPLAAIFAQDEGPSDVYVSTLDVWASEIYIAGKQSIESEVAFGEGLEFAGKVQRQARAIREQGDAALQGVQDEVRAAEDEFIEGLTYVTLVLASRGYTGEQILEALFLGPFPNFVRRGENSAGPCFQVGGLLDDATLVEPAGEPLDVVDCGPVARVEATMSTTTTQPPQAEPERIGEPEPAGTDRLEWSAIMSMGSVIASFADPYSEATIAITREQGTDEFAIVVIAGRSIPNQDFFNEDDPNNPYNCTVVEVPSFVGSGTFDDAQKRLRFSGDFTFQVRYPDCPVRERDETRPFEVWVDITDAGLAGRFEGFEYTIPGPVPAPTGG